MREGNQDYRARKDWMQCMINKMITEIDIILNVNNGFDCENSH
jgi:hypothetical protein